MDKKKGFTLVELLAVIVLLGLLCAIAIPNALSLNSKVKERSYDTKIDLIEQGANNFGQSNLGYIRKGTSFDGTNSTHTCKFNMDDEKIVSVSYVPISSGFSESRVLGTNEYWCSRVTVADLVDSNNLDWDEKGKCSNNCVTEEDKTNYDNIVINPKNSNIINKCYVYIYYKNKRVYSYFDKNTCNTSSTTPTEGQEYRALVE